MKDHFNIDFGLNQLEKFLKNEYKLGFLVYPQLVGNDEQIYEKLKMMVRLKYSNVYYYEISNYKLRNKKDKLFILFRKENIKNLIIFMNLYKEYQKKNLTFDKEIDILIKMYLIINYEIYNIRKKLVYLLEILFYKEKLDNKEKKLIKYDYKKYKEYLEHNKLFQDYKKIIYSIKLIKQSETKLIENIIQKYNFKIDIEREVKFIKQNLFQNNLFCLCMETILKNLSKNDASKFQKRIYQYEKKYMHKVV